MRDFAALYLELDATTRTSEKIAALKTYFGSVDPADGAWALHFLSGRRFKRSVPYRQMAGWAAEAAGVPDWLMGECYEAVGDLSETISLLLPPASESDVPNLRAVVEEYIKPLSRLDDASRRALLEEVWSALGSDERFVYHKLLSGAFRVGVQRRMLVRALAELVDVDPGVIEHRLMGRWEPTPDDYRRLLDPTGAEEDPARPYPFFLASPLEKAPESLGDFASWASEWKWDGIRAQIIRRAGMTVVWSRGEEIITPAFPELRAIGDLMPDGTVLDGEVLAWDDGPLPFAQLQRRLNRKAMEPRLFDDVPIVYQAYDLLESGGMDRRDHPFDARRDMLVELVGGVADPSIRLSTLIECATWDELAALQSTSRERGVEGIMLKRRDAPYRVGRVRAEGGEWFKWKIDPLTIDAVLIYAQPGSGRRASLFTDYTFGVWDGEELVPVAKAYSGLTDDEIKRVDAFVRRCTRARHGPLREVKPELVFELAFEAINESDRHKSGIALRFPRMSRWRHDKKIDDANTLQDLRSMLEWVNARRGRVDG